jgi:hypothetical protein
MVTIILAVALLVTLTGLGIEIGVASWNIRRASRYLRREAAAEHTAARAVEARQDMAKRLEFLDDYASKISWLLNFLYNRYAKSLFNIFSKFPTGCINETVLMK